VRLIILCLRNDGWYSLKISTHIHFHLEIYSVAVALVVTVAVASN
jgi:hypothetical protein